MCRFCTIFCRLFSAQTTFFCRQSKPNLIVGKVRNVFRLFSSQKWLALLHCHWLGLSVVVFDVSMNLYRLITDFSIRRFSGFLLILFFASIFHFEEINFQSFYFDFIQSLIYLYYLFRCKHRTDLKLFDRLSRMKLIKWNENWRINTVEKYKNSSLRCCRAKANVNESTSSSKTRSYLCVSSFIGVLFVKRRLWAGRGSSYCVCLQKIKFANIRFSDVNETKNQLTNEAKRNERREKAANRKIVEVFESNEMHFTEKQEEKKKWKENSHVFWHTWTRDRCRCRPTTTNMRM